ALLHDIWSDLLNLPTISIHDSFFDLGGHSMLALELVRRIKSSFGLDMAVCDVFRLADIESMARALE
ncbi:phosphopantetheine-binding protein, partial [Streptomyces sp. NPDC052415]|uniref:phosphopantetheine-binding protein n=1 Tax=Streptomyces sp. NPDC052415 TaxID=3365690 RepID=UPI0037D1937D